MHELINYKLEVPLDESEQNVLVVRVRANEGFSVIESFAVIQLHWKNNLSYEIIKIDGNQKEAVHVHNFFRGPDEKEYHHRPLSYETVTHYYEEILENWKWYLAQYQNHYI